MRNASTLISVTWTAAIAVGLGACIADVRTGRIPNALTLGAAVGALVVRCATEGLWSTTEGLAGWCTGAALLLPIFALGGLGGGDVKLLAAMGAWLGPSDVLQAGLYAAVAGGLLALAIAAATGSLRHTLQNVGRLLAEWRLHGLKPVPSMTLEHRGGRRLAYSIPIAIGVLCVWLLR